MVTAGFLYEAGAETPPNFREIFRVSLRTIFSAVDTQTGVFGSQHRIPKPLFLLALWVFTCFAVFLLGDNLS